LERLTPEELVGYIETLNAIIENRLPFEREVLQQKLNDADDFCKKKPNDLRAHGRFLALKNLVIRFEQIRQIREENVSH
jgi:hypothetical protein